MADLPIDDTAREPESPSLAATFGPQWRVRRDKPLYEVSLWPNQSMTRPGYLSFMFISAAFLAMPLVMALGTHIFWGLLPFMGGALWGLWYAIRRNGQRLQILETLTLWRDEVRVERREPDGRILRWQAEPMRVRIRVHKDAKVEDYLTLAGGGREIELGAFLAPEERVTLADELELALNRAIRA